MAFSPEYGGVQLHRDSGSCWKLLYLHAIKENMLDIITFDPCSLYLYIETDLMSAIIDVILVTKVWFLAKIFALGAPSYVNISPYFLAIFANPLSLKMLG